MSFWDKVKNVATSAKCMTGFHAGEYKPIKGKPKCNLEKTCPDCDKYLTKTQHKYTDWEYIKEDKCDSKKECVYCQFEEKKVRHQWVNRTNRCKVYKNCKRCKKQEFVHEKHGPWTAGVAHPDGMQTFICSGCGKTEERKFDPSAR
jgi:hypothetical protein